MTTLAIDIGGTKLAAALVDENMQIGERREIPTPGSQTPDALSTALHALVAPLVQRATRVAVASTGIIQDGNLLAINPRNLGGLLHFPLVRTLKTITGLPVIAINDAQAAAWAEYHATGRTGEDLVFITVSTGVGGGMVCGGTLQRGYGGLAGHLGHTLADPQGPLCGCGRKGCVEAIASGRGITAQAQDDIAGQNARAIFAHASGGHSQAQRLVERSAQTIAQLIANVKVTTDCRRVVVGGSVGLAQGYLEKVRAYLAQEPAVYQVEINAARYRHDAGLLGAALLAQGEK